MKYMENKKTPSVRMMYKNISLDERTKDYVLKRISKLEKFNSQILEFEVEISVDKKGLFRVEIMVKTPYELYRAEETSESVEGSIDVATEDMANQINKDKKRIKELRERGARSLKKKMVIDQNARFRK